MVSKGLSYFPVKVKGSMTGLWDRRSSWRDLEQPCLVSLSSAIESSASYSLPNELTQRFNDERERERETMESEVSDGGWASGVRPRARGATPSPKLHVWGKPETWIRRIETVYCITIAHHTIIYYSGCFKTNIPIIQRTYCIIYSKSVPKDVYTFWKSLRFSEGTGYLEIFRLFSEGLRIWHLPCYYKLAA